MPRLIRVFAGQTSYFVGFVMLRLNIFQGKGKMGTIGDRNIFLFPQHHDDPAVIVILDRKPTVVVDIVIDYF